MARRRRLTRAFYRRDPREVAPELLGKLLVRDGQVARIVEVEAYCGSEDPGSHAYRGLTKRNATMFGAPGCLYVYFTYGMHWCANAVCGDAGDGVAVLLRAAEPVSGLDVMRARRPKARRDRDLLAGPARLCQAFALSGAEDGADLVTASHGMTIVDDGTPPPDAPLVTTRVGLSAGADLPWRWCTPGSPHLSRPG
jgi:DNA-3-methyladenine glycosylase